MFKQFMTEKVGKIITFFDTTGFSDTCTNCAAIDSNDNYIHKVSENSSFSLVDFVDLKIFKFKSQKFLWDTLYTFTCHHSTTKIC